MTRAQRGTEETKGYTVVAGRWLFFGVLCSLGVLCFASEASAQLNRPKAEVAPLVERPAVAAGDVARVALRVSVPEGLHTQSNKPRDPLLIPSGASIVSSVGISSGSRGLFDWV